MATKKGFRSSARSKRKAKRKKIEIKKKEFSYRGLSLEELKKIGHVVGVVGGKAKFKAIRAALIGSLIDVLITDHITAEKLLQS